MSALLAYHERFFEVLKTDADTMLSEADIAKRNHKQIKALLEMASECEEKIAALAGNTTEWNLLSSQAKDQIMEIIRKDLGKDA